MKKKECIVAAGVDDFSHLKCAQEAGADLILLYPTAKYQSAGNRFLAGYLAFGNTNEMMLEIASEYMPIVNKYNVLAGINGSDPFKIDHLLLTKLKNYHFTGLHNYPSMSLVDGNFGMNIDSLVQGTDKEIDLFKKAKEAFFFTCAMVENRKDAILMAKADVDMLILYLGLGNSAVDIRKVQNIVLAIRSIRKDLPILFFHEHITNIEETKNILRQVPELNGYCLLPLLRKNVTERQLELEIHHLKSIHL